LDDGKKKFQLIKDAQIGKYKVATEKAGITYVVLKTFEEFVKKD
jgi:hypothetical protein